MTLKPHSVDIVTVEVMEMSTRHITKEDNAILKAHVDVGPESHPQVIMEYEHGFMVSAWHNFVDNPEDLEKQLLGIGHSPAYINLLRVARDAGAKWLNLDCDSTDYSFLPEYQW